jgi:hypothetical protein
MIGESKVRSRPHSWGSLMPPSKRMLSFLGMIKMISLGPCPASAEMLKEALVLLSLCALRCPVSTTYIPEQFCKVPKNFSWSITPSPSDLIVSLKISNGTSSTLSILTYDSKRKIVCPSKLPYSFNCTPCCRCFLGEL